MTTLVLRGGVLLWLLGLVGVLLAQLHGSHTPGPQLLYLARHRGQSAVYLLDTARQVGYRLVSGGLFANRVPLAWSPDGQYIALAVDREIEVMAADGRGRRSVSQHPELDWFPAWSPDGRQIAFVSHRDGNQEIYSADLATGALRNLTQHSANDTLPAWSPDGRWIAFQSQRSDPPGLYLLAAGGKAPRRLADFCGNTPPLWSPDSQRLIFVSYCTGGGDIFAVHVLQVGIPGSRLQRLTHNPNDDIMPTWAGDAETLVFVSTRDRNRELYRLTIGSSDTQRLTHHPSADMLPAGALGQDAVAFISLRAGTPALYLLEVAAQRLRFLAVTNDENAAPLWRPGQEARGR